MGAARGKGGASSLPLWPARDIVLGPVPSAGGSSAPSTCYVFGGRPVWEDGTLTKFRCYSGAVATLKLKQFRRAGNTFTWISEQSLTTAIGLNTYSVAGATLTGVPVLAGDFFAVYSATANFVQFKSPTVSGLEYYATGSDMVTSFTVGVTTAPTVSTQLMCEFTVSVPAKPSVAAVGNIIYLGEPSPTTGTGNSPTTNSYFDEKPWVVPARLETLQVYAGADGYLICFILSPTATGYSSRAFAVGLLSGINNLVAGTDFPIDVLIPAGGLFGYWPTTVATRIDTNTSRLLRILDGTIGTGLWPIATINAFAPSLSSGNPQVKAGFRPTQAISLSTTIIDQSFPTAIPPWFSSTNWSVSSGKAVNSSTGLLNSILYRCIATYDSTVTAYVTFTGATDKFAVVRSPATPGPAAGFGTVGTVDLSTNKIAILNTWDGTSTVPAVKTEKVSTLSPFVVGREYKVDLIRLDNLMTLTVTDTTNSATDSLVFNCWAGGVTVDYTAGRCFGLPGFAVLTGIVNVSRFLFTVPVARPTVLQVGDSITDGSGATSQANGYTGLVKAALSGSAAIAGIGGSGSTYPDKCMEFMVRQFLPQYATLLIGTNDPVYATWQTNIVKTIEYVGMLSGYTTLYIGAVPPQAANNIPEVQMNPYLRANYPGQIMDFDYALTTGRTGLGANLIAGDMYDTLHPNNTGHAAMYTEEQADVPFV